MIEKEYEQKLKAMEEIQAKYEKRLEFIEEIQALQDLHYDYIYWVNLREWDKIIELFTEDCSANIGPWGIRHGKAALQKLFKQDIGGNNKGTSRDGHVASMPAITLDGDKAHAHWMLFIMIADPVKGNRWDQGRHDVDYLKIDGKWKIHNIWYRRWPTPAVEAPRS